jgi:hypothetical protein
MPVAKMAGFAGREHSGDNVTGKTFRERMQKLPGGFVRRAFIWESFTSLESRGFFSFSSEYNQRDSILKSASLLTLFDWFATCQSARGLAHSETSGGFKAGLFQCGVGLVLTAGNGAEVTSA